MWGVYRWWDECGECCSVYEREREHMCGTVIQNIMHKMILIGTLNHIY